MKTSIANQSASAIIPERRDMPRQYHIGDSGAKTAWIHGFLGATVLLALLAARSAPPQFPAATTSASSIHALDSQDHRPRFNFNETKWSLPGGGFQPLLSAKTSRPLAAESPLLSSLQAAGIHYNRPPPA